MNTEGKYQFNSYTPGMYKICFSNEFSSLTKKVVVLDVHTESPAEESKLLKEGK